jgi:hypothetical protein
MWGSGARCPFLVRCGTWFGDSPRLSTDQPISGGFLPVKQVRNNHGDAEVDLPRAQPEGKERVQRAESDRPLPTQPTPPAPGRMGNPLAPLGCD